MDKEYIKFLYENYNKKHNFANSLGDFETDLKDKEYRKFLFDEYNPKANFAKSYDEFETDLGLKKKDLPNQDVSKPYVFGGEKPKLGYTASEVLEKSSTSKSPSTSELGNQPTPKDEIKIDFKPVVGGAFNANAAAENEDAARQERIDLGRQKLRFLTSDNKVKQDRIASIGALKQLNAEAQPILDQITEIQSHAVDNQLPPELYGHYQELQNQLEPYKQQIDALSNNISKSYDVSNTLLAGIRSVDAKYQNVLSKQFTLGKKASSAILQTRDNLVKSAGRIVETVGDLAAAQQEWALGINAPHDDKKWTDEMGKSIDEYANNLSKITDQTLPQSYKTYSPVGDKFDLDKFLYFGMNSTAQLAPTIGAALATGGAGAAMTGFTMEFGGMYDTFHEPIKKKYLDQGYSEAEAENKADIEAGIISTAGSAIIGQLDRFGSGKLIDSFGKKALMKRYATVAAENIGEKLGKEYAVEVTKKTLKKVIGEFASGFIKATAPEAGTEFAQELVAPAGQDIYDLATGGDTFKGVQLANKQTWENAANAGIGAFVASGIGGIGAGYKNIANPTNYEIAMNVKDEDDFQMFSNAIKNEINAGFITEEMAQSAIDNVKRIQEADKLLPNSVDNPMARSQAVALLLERQDIEAEIEGKDKNLVEPQDNRIKEINNLLKSISNGNIVPDNIQDDGSIRNTIRNKNKAESTNTGGEGVPTLTTGTEQTPTDGTGVQKPTAPNIKQEGLGEGETAQTEVVPETKVELTEEEKLKDNKAAKADGWENAPYAINSINSWIDGAYKSFKEIPTYIKKFVAGVRSLIDQHTDPSDAIKASRKYLDQAVSDGEITQEQADEISNKVSNNFTKKREAKNKLGEAIAETTKLGKSNLKQTMVNGLTLIKEKFKSRIKGEKIGEKNTKTFYKDLRDKFIEQYRQDKKGGNINLKEKNERRLISLINGIKNEKTLEKALDYLKDVSKSNDFADKKDEARALRKKIVPKKAGNKINEVKTFKDINPSDINDEAELDKYIESAKALINGKTADLDIKFDKKENKIDEAFDHAKNWQNLQDALDALENTEIVDSKTLRSVARQYAKAKKAIDMLKETGVINEEDYIDALARVNEAIDKIDEDFQQYKQETIDTIKDQKASLSINDVIKSLNNPEWASKVKEFFAINDYEDMGIVDLENMSSILDNLADGQVNEEFVNFIKDQNIRKGAEEFAPTFEQAVSAEEEFKSGWQKIKDIFYSPIGKFKTTEEIKNKMRELSPSELDRFMGTLVNGVGSFFNNVYSKFIIPAEVEYSKAVDKALTQLKNITHKLTPVENKMVGLILIQRQHIANLTEEKIAPLLKDWEKKFELKNDRKPTPEESAEAVKSFNDYFKTINDTFPEKRANTDATEKENKEDREAYDNLRSMGIIREDGSVATDEEIAQKTGNLDSDSKKAKVLKAVKEVRQILDGLKDKNEINTISLGKELENIEEYYPLFTRNLNETKGNKSLEEQAKRSITGTVHSALGLESGSTEKRRNTLNDVSLDLNDNVAKAIRDVNKQFYYLNALQTTLGILNRAAAKKSIKYSANRKSVMNALIQSTRGYIENKFLAQASSSVFGKMVSNLKLSILARLSKPLVEYTANLIKAITLDASFVKSIAVFGEDEKARENLISHLSLLSLKTTKHTSETTSIEDSWLKRQMSNIVRFADNAIALNYWYHKFGKEFKKQTGKDFDAKKYNTDEEYRNYVHNQTVNFLGTIEKDVEFVVGNQSAITQPQVRPSIPFSNFFRHKRWYEKSFGINSSFYRFFNPFTSFVAKERRTLLDGVGDLRRGDYRLGTAKIASVYASNAVYTYGMAISGNLTASAIAYLISSAMDDDDKYKALMEQIRKNRLNAAEDLFTKESFALQSIGAMFGASLAQYGYLVRPVLAFMIGEYLKTADKNMAVKLQKIVKQSNTVYPNVYSKEPILDYGLQLAGVASGMEQSVSALYEASKGLSDKTKAQEELSNYIGLGAATYGISQMFFPFPSSTDFLNVARDAQRLTSFKAATSGLKKLADEWYIAKENNDAVRMALIDKRADSFINDFLTKSYKGIKSSDFHNLYSTMQKVRSNYKTYEAFVNEVEPELIREKNEAYSKVFNFMLKK